MNAWLPVLAGGVSASGPLTFSDTFNRANEDPLSGSGAWTSGITGFVGMKADTDTAVSTAGTSGFAFVSTPSFAAYPDQEATITLNASGLAGVGACVRILAAGTGYTVFITNTTTIQITALGVGQLGANVTVPTLVAGDTVGLRIVGSAPATLTLYVNGVSITTRTDSTYATGSPGIRSLNTTSRINGFSCTSI
jgi:hypothetical protein